MASRTALCPRKAKDRLLTPHCAQEVHGVAVVRLDPGGDGQHVGVEDDVLRGKACLLGEQAVGTGAYRDAPFEGVGLPLFVKGHDHRGRPVGTDEAGFLQERGLALLETDGVDDALTLHALQSGLDGCPLGRVNHHGHTGHVRLRAQVVEESAHFGRRVEHGIVHVDVKHLRPVLHLAAGEAQGFLVSLVLDEPQEFARARHVAAFADDYR